MAAYVRAAVPQASIDCRCGPEPTEAHMARFAPDPRTITWERLEFIRLKQLGLSNKYSRNFNVLRTSKDRDVRASRNDVILQSQTERPKTTVNVMHGSKRVNSIAPFATLGKPTCGYFFSEGTDNRKLNFGIPPSDLVKWRTFPNTSFSSS